MGKRSLTVINFQLYRHTYLARYTILELSTQREVSLRSDEATLHYAAWGPVGNSVVYVWNNNIYYKPSALSTDLIAVTQDGEEGHVYNGVPDWVYEGKCSNYFYS